MPAASPRVSLVTDGGHWAYVREGKKYSGGIFGGDLEDAVRGNAQAEEYARAYQGGLTGGFVVAMLGAAGIVSGAVVTGAQSENGQSVPPAGPLILAGGIVAYLVGLGIMVAAQPHLTDAINVYNDSLLAPTTPAPVAPSAPPTGPASTQPL